MWVDKKISVVLFLLAVKESTPVKIFIDSGVIDLSESYFIMPGLEADDEGGQKRGRACCHAGPDRTQ